MTSSLRRNRSVASKKKESAIGHLLTRHLPMDISWYLIIIRSPLDREEGPVGPWRSEYTKITLCSLSSVYLSSSCWGSPMSGKILAIALKILWFVFLCPPLGVAASPFFFDCESWWGGCCCCWKVQSLNESIWVAIFHFLVKQLQCSEVFQGG